MKQLTKMFRLVWNDEKQLKFSLEAMEGITYVSINAHTAEFDSEVEAREFVANHGLIVPDEG